MAIIQEEFPLEVVQLAIRKSLSRDYIENAQFEVWHNVSRMMIDALAWVNVSAAVIERVECEWPRDWWQALKERWSPAWAKRRWSVKFERRVLTAKALLPKVPTNKGPFRLDLEAYTPFTEDDLDA